jgi:hypothetical protein
MSTYSGVLNSFSNPAVAEALLAQRRKAMQGPQSVAALPDAAVNPAVDTQALIDQRVGQPQVPQGGPTAEGLLADTAHQANVAGVASPDRRIRNQSGHELYGADARNILPGPATDAYEDTLKAGPPQKHGFLAHLAGIGKGFLMGGPAGMIAGGISPNLIERANYNLHTLPMAEHRADYEQQQQAAALGREREVAGMTGMYNGEPSLPYKEFEQRQEALSQQRKWQQYYQNETLKDKATGRDIQRDKFDWTKEYQGKRLEQHQQGLNNGSHQLVKGIGANGHPGWFSVNKADPSDVVQIADEKGNQLGTVDEMLEGGRMARFTQGQNRADARQDKSIGAAAVRQDKAIGAAGARQDKDSAAGKYKKTRMTLFGEVDENGHLIGSPTSAGQPPATGAPHDVALQTYQSFVKAHPDKKEAARQKYIKQRGIDPETGQAAQ